VTATDKHDNITLLPSILPPCATSGDDLAAARPSIQHDEASIDLHANLVDYSELKIAKALARHSVEIGPPKLCPESRGTRGPGQDARRWNQGQENLIDKCCLYCEIRFTAILKNVQMQMSRFSTDLEPNTKQGQGADLTIITVLTLNNPGAITF